MHARFLGPGPASPSVIQCACAQVTMSAPVTSEGLGTATTSLIFEKTYDI